MDFRDMKYRLATHFSFSKVEIKNIIIVTLLCGFIMNFRSWGVDSFDLMYGLSSWVNVSLIVLLAIIVNISVHKIAAIHEGYNAEYAPYFPITFIALILAFMSNGWVALPFIGGAVFTHIPHLRIGKFRYGLNYFRIAVVGAYAVISNLCLALFFKMFLGNVPSGLIYTAILVNILVAITSLVPLPNYPGLNMFFASRIFFGGIAFATIATSAALWKLSLISSIILFITVSILGWGYMYWYEYIYEAPKPAPPKKK